MQAGIALVHFFAGRFDSAADWAETALGNVPSLVIAAVLAAASHALAGRPKQAQEMMQRLQTLDPTLRVSRLRHWLPVHRSEDVERLEEGLRLAGLPE